MVIQAPTPSALSRALRVWWRRPASHGHLCRGSAHGMASAREAGARVGLMRECGRRKKAPLGGWTGSTRSSSRKGALHGVYGTRPAAIRLARQPGGRLHGSPGSSPGGQCHLSAPRHPRPGRRRHPGQSPLRLGDGRVGEPPRAGLPRRPGLSHRPHALPIDAAAALSPPRRARAGGGPRRLLRAQRPPRTPGRRGSPSMARRSVVGSALPPVVVPCTP